MTEFLNSYPFEKPLIFDSHAHYDDAKFEGIRDDLLTSLPESGISGAVTCGCDTVSSKAAMQLSEKYSYIYFAAGIHPENIDSGSNLTEIAELAKHKKCVAIGEIGLDYYWVSDNKNAQIELFESQLEFANKLGLPVIVHDRDAHADTLTLLKKHRPKGVVHSFSGSPEMAAEILSLGMYIGIGGVVTFKNAKRLPEVVKMLPGDRFLLETDAPYLAPVPYRSKLNHSAMILLTAQKIAELRNTETEKILSDTLYNSHNLFKI